MCRYFLILCLFVPMTSWAGAKLKVDEKFPEYNLKELGSEKKSTKAQTKGKVVIVDFWASWCEPCKKEIPALNKIFKKYKAKGLLVVGINVDEAENTAKDFLKDHKVDFLRLYDVGKKLADQCALATMPSSFVLDRTGTIKFIHAGYHDGDPAKFEAEIKMLF